MKNIWNNVTFATMSVERVEVNEAGSPWHEEHLSRYAFAKEYFPNKKVLDIACGTGFGSVYIAEQAPSFLYAADVSTEAIKSTKGKLQKSSTHWECGIQDGTNLQFEDNSFDVIISIETVEHIENDEKFVRELHRVLRPNGTLILSTPNGLITNPNGGKPENPFHIREYTPSELNSLLSPFFKPKLFAGQDVKLSYGIAPFLPSYGKRFLTSRQKLSALFWSLALRLPAKLRNNLWNIKTSHNFYPRVEDYTFFPENRDKAHVQYFIGTKK